MDKAKEIYNHEYFLRNQEKIKESQQQYRETHREQARLRTLKWRNEHKYPCPDCGKAIDYKSLRCRSCASKHGNTKFRKPPTLCIDCGKPVSRGRGLRCSRCAGTARRRRPRLDNERYIARQGYIMMKNPQPNPKQGFEYILEHRYIWEQAHGQLIPNGWHIHHLNGIRSDNRVENLVPIAPANHGGHTYIKALQEKIRLLEQCLENAK